MNEGIFKKVDVLIGFARATNSLKLKMMSNQKLLKKQQNKNFNCKGMFKLFIIICPLNIKIIF